MFGRNNIAAVGAEFLGVGVLTLVILSVQRSNIGIPYFVALAAGLVVGLYVFAVNRAIGAQMNPALTLGLWTARRVSTVRAVLYIVAQLLGAWAAFGIYKYLTHNQLQAIGGQFTGRILVAEAIGTGVFSFGYAAAVLHRVETGAHSVAAGVAYALGMIVASSAAIGLINPAVAEGVHAWKVWGSLGWGNYVLGPVIGAVIGVNLYTLLFAPNASLAAAAAGVRSTVTSVTTGKAGKKNDADKDKKKPISKKR